MLSKFLLENRSFETLADNLLNPKPEKDLPVAIRDAFRHGRIYEPVVREKYIDIMRYHLNRDVRVRETGLVVQPLLFWLAASPDGLVTDKSNESDYTGLLKIKCPKTKRNRKIEELVSDETFYISRQNGTLFLKKNHPNGYYT